MAKKYATIQTLKNELKKNRTFYLIILLFATAVSAVVFTFLLLEINDTDKLNGIFAATASINLIIQLALITAVVLLYVGALTDKQNLIKAALIILITYFITFTALFAALSVLVLFVGYILLTIATYPILALAAGYTVCFTVMLFRILHALKTEDGKFVPSYYVYVMTIIFEIVFIAAAVVGLIYNILKSEILTVFGYLISISVSVISMLLLIKFFNNIYPNSQKAVKKVKTETEEETIAEKEPKNKNAPLIIKIIFCVCATIIVSAGSWMSSFAIVHPLQYRSNEVYYVRKPNRFNYTVTKSKGGIGTTYILSEVKNLPVTEIEDSAFSGRDIFEVYIEDGIKVIGKNAFHYCWCLMSVHIPDSITTINYGAFSDCKYIRSIVIPQSVTFMGEYIFQNSGLTHIYCESETAPQGWLADWNSGCSAEVYWGGTWQYDDGVPVPN